jgi:hypothetical protein
MSSSSSTRYRRWVAFGSVLLSVLFLGSDVIAQYSTYTTPIGPIWDCVLSGKRNGLAYLSFSTTGNGTVSGYEILVPQPIVSPRTSLISDVLGNNGLGIRPATTTATTNIFGYFPINGLWGFDAKGRITGHFLEVVRGNDCTSTVIPISTNIYESQVPISGVSETNLFTQTFCVTQPIFTNTFFSYTNQRTCYLPAVPLSTNTFSSPLPYVETNHLPSGTFCVTMPIATNLDLITFTEGMTHYVDRMLFSSNSFVSPTAITQTNYLPDGTWCETYTLQPNTFADTYTVETTCWTNPVMLTTFLFTNASWFAENRTLPGGTIQITMPILTNTAPRFTEQVIYYSVVPAETNVQFIPIGTNSFVSDDPISTTNYLADGTAVVTLPIAIEWVAVSYVEQTTLYAAATPASVNTFPSATPYAQSDINPNGTVCVTVPIFTNLSLISFNILSGCYTNGVPIEQRSFVSAKAITQTNLLPDGSYWVTVPLHTNTFSGTFTEQMTCYIEPVELSSSTSVGPAPINETETFPGGMYCVTVPIFTNAAPGTYVNQQICYALQTDCSGVFTNVVNFTAKASPWSRLTLTAKTPLGVVTMRGVPSSQGLSNLGGAWAGVKKQAQTTTYEFFNVRTPPIGPNTYVLNGDGPDYTYLGVMILSSQKRIALAFDVNNLDGTYRSTRASVGSFNIKKQTSGTSGVDSGGGPTALTNRVNFQVTKRLSLP